VHAVEAKFGVDDYRKSVQYLLPLRQEGSIEEYTQEFQAIRYQVSMFDSSLDELFFTSHYINGLKEEVKSVVQPQLLEIVDRAALLAKIHQQAMSRIKFKQPRWSQAKAPTAKFDTPQQTFPSLLWKERQLRDYRKAHDLCYYCGEKFEQGHLQKCTKKNRPQVNALVVNDIGEELTEETLNQLAVEEVLAEEIGQLSLNAILGTESGDAMLIHALVQNKVMLILVGSGNSHSFVSKSFLM
jgi:hypothetical protein